LENKYNVLYTRDLHLWQVYIISLFKNTLKVLKIDMFIYKNITTMSSRYPDNINADLEYRCKNIVKNMLEEYKLIHLMGIDYETSNFIEYYITTNISRERIKELVYEYDVFKAIELHREIHGDFDISNMRFNNTYNKLAITIIQEYVKNNNIVI